jgi:alanine racemase
MLEAAGFMTHLATADEADPSFLKEQLERFDPVAEEARRACPGIVVHAANSAATLREPAAHYDMARCGIAIYGLCPFHRDPAEAGLEPALSLESYVAAVKRVEPGESVGYGRSWAAERGTRVAVLPIGYGDGYRRGLSNLGAVLIGGRRFPVVGTISMDNVTVDVGADDGVRVGDRAVLIGAQGDERVLAEELARKLGTINYEVTCGLTARVPRVHRAAKSL